MTSYAYINNLFKAILTNSKAIKGRFYMGYRYGLQDINYDELGAAIDEAKQANKLPDKYPLSMLAPPNAMFRVAGMKEGWERFRMVQYFATTQNYGPGMQRNPNTNTGTHEPFEVWHDMRRCAFGFLKVLDNQMRLSNGSVFRLPANDTLCIPFTKVGVDGVSGVHINYDFDLFTGCLIEDYDDYPAKITLPLNGHSEHTF